jgi:hypothetical protein
LPWPDNLCREKLKEKQRGVRRINTNDVEFGE